jgi:hypothetical protein
MSLLSRLNPFNLKRKDATEVASDRIRAGEGGVKRPSPAEILREAMKESIPPGVDFTALWEEPDEGGSFIGLILSGVAAAAAIILLVMHFFGK